MLKIFILTLKVTFRDHSRQIFMAYQNFGPKMDDTFSKHTVEIFEGLIDLLKRLEEVFNSQKQKK